MDYREKNTKDETGYGADNRNEKNEGESVRADDGTGYGAGIGNEKFERDHVRANDRRIEDGAHFEEALKEENDKNNQFGESSKRDDGNKKSESNLFVEPDEEGDDYGDFEEDFDAEEASNYREGRAGEIAFRIIAGVLVLAICVTATLAALLATGRLNGVIDVLSDKEAENTAAEISDKPTPTVRVALTSTPTPVKDPTVTSAPTAAPSPTAAPTAVPEKTDGKDTQPSASDSAAVMTFTEVNDVVTAKETTNLRNVPSQGEESFIVYILQNGETVNRTGISDEGWSRLEYDGQVVYAMTNLLTTDLTKKEPAESTAAGLDESGELPQIQTVFTDVNEQVTPKIEVNLRLLPSVTNPNATVIATIKNGEVVTRTGVNEELGWSRVEYNGQTLYCISSYVETVTPQA